MSCCEGFEKIDNLLENRWFRYLSLLALALVLLLPGTSTLPLMDRDEPRFAQATQEMMDTEQWIVPYFNGDYRFDKPPLTYWWMRVHYWVFGKTELGARLHSVFAAALAAMVICRLGTFFFSTRAGWLSGVGFLTCLQVVIHGRICVADMPMILAVIATMDASCRLLLPRDGVSSPKRFGPLFWYLTSALAVGFLAKGPIAWAVPILAWALFRWPIGKRPLPWRNLQLVSAFGIALLVVAAWGIPALISTKGEFWSVGIGEHVVDRGLKPLNSRPVIPGVYYLGTVLLSLLPWTAFTFAPVFGGESPRTDPKRAILLAWYIAPFLIFSFYATQLPHYILPGFAGLFLLLFRSGGLPSMDTPGQKRWFWGVTGFFGVVFGIALIGLLVMRSRIPAPLDNMIPVFGFALGVITLFSVLMPLAIYLRKGWMALPVLAIGVLICGVGLARSIRERSMVVDMKEAISEAGAMEGASYMSYRFGEPSQIFYLDSEEKWKFAADIPPVKRWMANHEENGIAVFRTKVWRMDGLLTGESKAEYDDTAKVKRIVDPAKYETRTIQGFNAARTTWEEVIVAIPKKG
ncbi:MAG: hypothetical protein CMO55_29155 [Verrucomicrobiales bacterium]|nr:hypothetical protein [Verrucomicrobiales bacterium]